MIKATTTQWEGMNMDLRHYIPIFAHHSRCFAWILETLESMIGAFVNVCNRFGLTKYHHRRHRPTGIFPLDSLIYFKNAMGHSLICIIVVLDLHCCYTKK